MSSLHVQLLLVYAAAMAAALGGWFAPVRRGAVARDELLVCAVSIGLACALRRDVPTALSLATLFPSSYLAFRGWKGAAAAPRAACAAACLGAAWFLLSTSQRVDLMFIAGAIGIAGPRLLLWVSERASRNFGLALVVAATLFQLTRIPILLAS